MELVIALAAAAFVVALLGFFAVAAVLIRLPTLMPDDLTVMSQPLEQKRAGDRVASGRA